LVFSLLAFWRLPRQRFPGIYVHRNLLAVFAILFILFVFFQRDFRIRYMAPAIVPLVLLSMFGLFNIIQKVTFRSSAIRLVGKNSLVALVIFALGLNASYVAAQFKYVRPFDYLTGKVDRDTYITRYRSEHPVMLYANQTLPEDARVLCLSVGKRTYYMDRDAHLALDFYNKRNGIYSEPLLISRLKRYGTTHVILNRDVYLNWIRHLPRSDRETFENVFKKHTRLIYQKYGVQLLELNVDES